MLLRRSVFLSVTALAGVATLALAGWGASRVKSARAASANGAPAADASPGAEGSAHQFTFTAIEGGTLPLSDYRGKVVMVVNTASQCGFTNQYAAMQSVWQRYRDDGLIVLAVPSDDFNQELATEAAVQAFCETTFGVDFPMTSITPVSGARAHPFYAWARRELGALSAPRWNFHKYLIDRQGRLVAAFSTTTAPDSRRVRMEIEQLLAGSPG